MRPKFNGPDSVDARFAIAALTASDAHPLQIGLAQGQSVEELDGDWLHLVDSVEELDRKWPSVLASGTDIVKVFLVNSDEYAERRGNPAVAIRHRGIDPSLIPRIVELAAGAGLAVTAHVRTASDFRNAVSAGVREIAHLPGFAMGPTELDEIDDPRLLAELDEPERFTIRPADADLAAARGVVVQTTLLGLTEPPPGLPDELLELVVKAIGVSRSVQIANLILLAERGVTLAIGSDAGEETVIEGIRYLEGLGVFDRAELLHRATADTTRSLFPARRLGSLADGFEASFIVLGRNPLDGFDALDDITLRVKRGRVLSPSS